MTVFTPDCVERMVAKGTFRKVALKDLKNADFDEAFLFRFPSNSIINEMNGDGDWIEVWDYATDATWVSTARGEIPATPETIIYVR